jgi:hypothetical protein
MLVQRIWTRSDKKIQSETHIILQVWDSGSTRYERITDTDVFWKVIERSLTDSGFTETLLELPAHLTPTDFTWKEESPVRILERGSFEIPGWRVETKILKS